MEIFILHTFLVKDAEVAEGENQNQLMLLYAIHNPTGETAIDMWTSLHLHTESNLNTSDKRIKIDMCEIKPSLFCKLRQSPYKVQVATLELSQEMVNRLYQEETELEVIFEYVTEVSSAELFAKGLKSDYPPNDIKSITKKLTLHFMEPDYQSESLDRSLNWIRATFIGGETILFFPTDKRQRLCFTNPKTIESCPDTGYHSQKSLLDNV